MPDETEKKVIFPILPVRTWWELRRRFNQKIPTKVDANYLSTCLSIGLDSAKNLIPDLIRIGLINPDGVPKERATAWRDDVKYPQVCSEILKEVYPPQLIEAAAPPSPDANATQRWFANETALGEVATRKMTTFYLLLCEADPSKGKEKELKQTGVATTKPIAARKVAPRLVKPQADLKGSVESGASNIPSIHMDIQIHISPETTPEQIEKIFSCLAKYFDRKGEMDEQETGNS